MSRPPQRVFHPLTFGKYYLIDRIGTGGMAEVFRALPIRPSSDPATADDLLVIKRILPHIAENEDFLKMFSDEAKISAALRHPNVVRVFDFGQVHNDPYIAMEYVDGKDVRNVLRRLAHRDRFLDLSICATIAHDVCQGLHYAHTLTDEAGVPYDVVHRDVSPANVLLGYDGTIKLTDFGVAKASSNVNRTKSGIFKGKFDYMSPEQAEGRDIDHRADIFALGIVLFEMLTCRRLFKADSEIATLQKIRDATVPSTSHYRPGVAPEIDEICLRALARDRDDRYPTALAMAEALRDFVGEPALATARDRLAEMLTEDFAGERASEQQRLAAGLGKVPVAAPPRLDATWEGGTPSTMADRVDHAPDPLRSALTGALVMVAVLVLLGGIGLGVAAFRPDLFRSAALSAVGPQGLTAEPGIVTGVELVIEPPGRVVVDGIPRGDGGHVLVDALRPGVHTLRVVAPGYAPHVAELTVEAGQLAPVVIELQPLPALPAEPLIEGEDGELVEPTEPVVVFESTPPGAEVWLDGSRIGVTPLTWTDGVEGVDYAIELRLPDHVDHTSALTELGPGETVFAVDLEPEMVVERVLLDPNGGTLQPEPLGDGAAAAAEPARLSIALDSPHPATVYVDGEALAPRAPFADVVVPPGEHAVRVVSEAAGIDWTTTETFEAGRTLTLKVSP